MDAPARTPRTHVSAPALAVLAALALACAPSAEAPEPVPYARAERLDPDVRERLATLLADARRAPELAERHGELGLLYEANDLWQEAAGSYANAAALEPADPLWRYHGALCLRQAGDFAGALERLRAVAAEAPELAAVQQRLGDWLVEAGALADAEAAYRAALARAPGSPEVLTGLADVHLARDRPGEAAELAREALAADPGYRLARYVLGRAYRALGRREEAARELALGVGAERRNLVDALSARLDGYRLNLAGRINQAADWIEAGQAERAVALLEPALARHGDDPGLLSNLGSAYQALGRLEEAQETFERATRADPGAFAGFLNLSTCLLARGREDEALAPALRAVELAPELAAAQFALGRALSAAGRHVEALEAFERAARLDPTSGQADVARAETCVQLGRLDEALARYDAAVRKLPEFLPAHVNRGIVALELGRVDVAVAAAEAARALDSGHAWLRELDRRIAEARRP